jgi:hypothetical protein
MDPNLCGKYSVKSAHLVAAVAKDCPIKRARERPLVAAVVTYLEPMMHMPDTL